MGVVVQHLLEVRDQPLAIGGVAGEASADLVVDAARRHGVEGGRGHEARAALRVVLSLTEQHQERLMGRKLGRRSEAAEARIEFGRALLLEGRPGTRGRARPRVRPARSHGETPPPWTACSVEAGPVFTPDPGDALEQRAESRGGRSDPRAESRFPRRRAPAAGSGTPSWASRPGRDSWPGSRPCRCRRDRAAPRDPP